MSTIIQHYGPIYGEAVNGTVQGRPNGSVYVPLSNRIAISTSADATLIAKMSSGYVRLFNTSFNSRAVKTVAESQDMSNYIMIELLDENDEVLANNAAPAGIFNRSDLALVKYTVEEGTTYKVRCSLYSVSNTPVAASDTIEVTGALLP